MMLIISIVAGVAIISGMITIYNVMIFSRNRVRQSLANIDVILKQRNDEIDNLVRVVKGYSSFERDVLEKITRIRSGFDPYLDVRDKDRFNKNIETTYKQLFANVENYPDIKADEHYMRLQQRITGLENQLADRREYYNWSVTNYNTRLETFPYSIIAGIFNFRKAELFKFS
ncbi:MAG: LemA family protein [candidate division WOR-3 bacterium]|nr:LemA family protein [candidate division WOR-3 bacterium]